MVSTHNCDPTERHFKAVKQMMRYMAGTITMGLVLGDQKTVTIEEEGQVIELDKETVLVGH